MLRSARHAKILEIISRKEIETQEELCAELNALHHSVTQATVSRDIRDLHLFKVSGIEKNTDTRTLTTERAKFPPR